MAIVRIIDVPENRRDAHTDVEMEVRGFRGATAVIAKDLRRSASDSFRQEVMRLWAEHGKSGGFAVRNGKHTDSWVMFEYSEGK
ncbi:hypothetical protein HWB76_gp021 [Streptomyces phage Blueeyedbeauty]|uniref:Uncharacterized protein n=1 Tax=Streptomyces phage Blueeyedbeauty TaxID=2250336 RepID=A0A345L277_9CAUD|nr:hypothetical protein HWB76_gp021 [Streptomyces phage Blueeyedbeauty]AXH49379.1 hypothetical protein SEA_BLUEEYEDBEAUTY_272 [Streptomyces phage Blueeyedbeauty]